MQKLRQLPLLQIKIYGRQFDIERLLKQLERYYEVRKRSSFVETGELGREYPFLIKINLCERVKALGENGREW